MNNHFVLIMCFNRFAGLSDLIIWGFRTGETDQCQIHINDLRGKICIFKIIAKTYQCQRQIQKLSVLPFRS